ncbi:MAG TPA: hypothetical protein PK089_09825 [Methanoregulaceae archaeon]|nr:hypothetical protein [Methanoregulaceae archaeon]HQJ87278.1 hypothetical protein [Methanoregulaceae archaeon]
MRWTSILGAVGAAVVLVLLSGCLGAGPDPAGDVPGVSTSQQVKGPGGTADPTAPVPRLELEVIYSGMWSGAYGTRDAIRSDEGFGNATLPVLPGAQFVQAKFQKQESNDEPLTLRLLRDGAVVGEATGAGPLAVVTLEVSLQ